ncbi:3'(2'),5'-bisphosphate nucleotidase CysQ [Rubrivivax sp. A210]|uniref:3'(2'),5'-bisphosphate nucleotidase CysQ n=1 Tax=Rubrivivax sp. A210 TaxID=2772301 RepID=UPI0019193403|nr:3'(2'),5'-bisphosphate nucleotidase CysQ [Rubrivivax sp. A210]CAD5367147.1 3'(2'),5'-bisphosphate nucleotidase CysQ [Rubrivivax sp. A210]
MTPPSPLPSPLSPPADLLHAVAAIARAAGAAILEVYGSDFAVLAKADDSPLTVADERAEALIVAALQALAPAVPVVAEEAASCGAAPPPGARFWLVDALDGTREFVARNGEFTVNIALVEQGEPVLGVVHLPVGGRLYAGACGLGAWLEQPGQARRAIACRTTPAEGPVLACSRSHGDEAALARWLAGRTEYGAVARRIAAGSSLKFGLIAAGEADLYPRLGRTMEWDTAAGHAVLVAAGGSVRTLDGQPLRYGKPGWENPHFIARGLHSFTAA